MTSLPTLAATVRAFANIGSAKEAFRGRPSLHDLSIAHVKEAARVLEIVDRHSDAIRAALGNVLPWEKHSL